MHVEQCHPQLGFARLLRAREFDLGHGHAQLLRDQAHGLGEGDVLDLLDKREHVTRNPAAETVKELPRGVH